MISLPGLCMQGIENCCFPKIILILVNGCWERNCEIEGGALIGTYWAPGGIGITFIALGNLLRQPIEFLGDTAR